MLFAATVFLLGACTNNKTIYPVSTDVEEAVIADNEYVEDNFAGCEYVWYESSITLNNFVDEEACDGSVMNVTNIFQVQIEDTDCPAKVVLITHDGELMQEKEVCGWWTEDLALDDAEITLTYKQAYERMMQADIIKPHSKYCVLRKPLGPYMCNPQYIFGNANNLLIFVDAVTGEVSDKNPAFNRRE